MQPPIMPPMPERPPETGSTHTLLALLVAALVVMAVAGFLIRRFPRGGDGRK